MTVSIKRNDDPAIEFTTAEQAALYIAKVHGYAAFMTKLIVNRLTVTHNTLKSMTIGNTKWEITRAS